VVQEGWKEAMKVLVTCNLMVMMEGGIIQR